MPELKWFVYGKHPMFADYFCLGDSTRLAMALKGWVISGYHEAMKKNSPAEKITYRFWMQGDGNQTLVFGLLQSSSDSLGRPFPLLIAATAIRPDWQKSWQSLSRQLAMLWDEIERIAGEKYASVQEIIADLATLSFQDPSGQSVQKDQSQSLPTAVFVGRNGTETTVMQFTRPLTRNDFVRLWILSNSSIA